METIKKNQAIISELSVKIKTIVVGSKELTLSRFKQIPIRNIIGEIDDADNPVILGKPWGGVVRYTIGGKEVEDGSTITRHLIWSDKENVFRMPMSDVRCTGVKLFYFDEEIKRISHSILSRDLAPNKYWELLEYLQELYDLEQLYIGA